MPSSIFPDADGGQPSASRFLDTRAPQPPRRVPTSFHALQFSQLPTFPTSPYSGLFNTPTQPPKLSRPVFTRFQPQKLPEQLLEARIRMEDGPEKLRPLKGPSSQGCEMQSVAVSLDLGGGGGDRRRLRGALGFRFHPRLALAELRRAVFRRARACPGHRRALFSTLPRATSRGLHARPPWSSAWPSRRVLARFEEHCQKPALGQR